MGERNPSHWGRRGFLAGLLAALGATLGWVTRRWSGSDSLTGVAKRTQLENSFDYDISEYEQVDPALLLYDPLGSFATTMQRPKRLDVLPGRGVAVVGDQCLMLYDDTGQTTQVITFATSPHCLRVVNADEILVGFADHYAVWNAAGQEMFRSPVFPSSTYLTSLDAHGSRVYAADAGHRDVMVCDRSSGRIQDRFGRKDNIRGNPGFNVPSPYFDLAISRNGQLHVANPGMLRVETYTLNGRFVSSWGEPGMRIDRFCGCCNPVHFTLTSAGNFITSEKGLARIKVHHSDGSFLGVVAGPKTLVDDKALAKRACHDCRIGAGFDVAVHANDELMVLDPFRKIVRRFRPKSVS